MEGEPWLQGTATRTMSAYSQPKHITLCRGQTDIRIRLSFVSRLQARVFVQQGRVRILLPLAGNRCFVVLTRASANRMQAYLVNESTVNPTELNGVTLGSEPVFLRHGDIFSISGRNFRFEYSE